MPDIVCQEINNEGESIPHIGLLKVIPLKLFLDVVPSSSTDIARPMMRGQPKQLSRSNRRRNGGNVIVYALISVYSRDVL